jgi:large subunit ribosomal protein L15
VIRQDTLSPAPGAKKARQRVGRGDGSNRGTYSGRGSKGQKSRAGNRMNRGFEGGQLPLVRRLPRKRGFKNRFRVEYDVVNLAQLKDFAAGDEVTIEALVDRSILKSGRHPVKVLGNGDINVALTVRVNKFSQTAKDKITAAGGKAEEVEYAGKAK